MGEAYESVTVEIKDQVAQVTLIGPGKGNAMGPAFWSELPELFRALDADPEVRAIVLTGSGKNFSYGLDGNVPFGKGEMPAKSACGILSVEFLVHAWDYAVAVGHEIDAPEPLSEYVLGLARQIIRPEIRSGAGFDDPVDVSADAGALEQLVAFTGRNPAR